MCMNKRVLIGLGVVGVAVLAFWPRALGTITPFLLLAACPLSMVFMMRSMSGGKQGDTAHGQPAPLGSEPLSAQRGDDHGVPMRELEEEVTRLRAEIHLRDQRSAS